MDHTDFSTDLVTAYLSTKFSYIAAIVVMVYDYVLTISHEKSIWQRRWSLGKGLYLFARYLGLLIAIFDLYVRLGDHVIYLSAAVLSAEGSKKVYAVYEKNKTLLVVLAASLALGTLASLLVMSLEIPTGPLVTAQWFWLGMLPPLINTTILCSLMILKTIQNYRYGYRSELLSGMIRDSMGYFVCIIVQSVEIAIMPIGDYAFQMDKYHIVHDGVPPPS
ncbi:hypothetical protein BU17DRAFT_71033 [Hysterangium stoloniferum]|nr:hypothetical protein BU17DRAFT_71033 [Hysterangium stoloniferum]